MTVRELKEKLERAEKQGLGDKEVVSFWKMRGGRDVYTPTRYIRRIDVSSDHRYDGLVETDKDADKKVFVIE